MKKIFSMFIAVAIAFGLFSFSPESASASGGAPACYPGQTLLKATSNVMVRVGPGTNYAVYGILDKGTYRPHHTCPSTQEILIPSNTKKSYPF